MPATAGWATATVGRITVPELLRRGYDLNLASGSLAGAGTFGLLIPPSIAMIIYGVLSGVSIGQLFLAGVVPGIALCAGLLVYASWRARKEGFPITEKMPWKDRLSATRRTLPALFLPLIIVVGIKGGVFTPTEAAAVAVVEEEIRICAVGVANLINIFNPEKVIIGGGVSEAGDWFVARIEAAAINLAMKAATREVTVMRARLGNKAGLLGAAAFALDQEGHA